MKHIKEKDVDIILQRFGIRRLNECKLIDSSREDDVRLNYIVDKKYVLRVNSAPVMTEKRISELNRLIKRYNDFGLIAPLFLQSAQGDYITEYKNFYCYVSEYADYELADNSKNVDGPALFDEVRISIAKFAQKYKNVDLSTTMSMYSLFELSPYDIPAGIDEKQENFDSLLGALKKAGETSLAQTLYKFNEDVRSELIERYPRLARCVFQGDENFSNVLVDGGGHFIGLIDFNMAGTDVIVNYFANALVPDFEEDFKNLTAKQTLDKVVSGFAEGFEILSRYYAFSAEEKIALNLYGKIVLLSSYPNERFYSFCLNSDGYKQKITEFLKLIPEVQFFNF